MSDWPTNLRKKWYWHLDTSVLHHFWAALLGFLWRWPICPLLSLLPAMGLPRESQVEPAKDKVVLLGGYDGPTFADHHRSDMPPMSMLR